jgi:NitT/TauT family transport system permease protein
MMPVIARVLGYDRKTVVAAAILVSFFPTFVFVTSGMRALPAGSADVLTVLGASKLRFLWHLALPAAIPGLLVALRISAANCILAALVAEFLMGTSGLGRLFATAIVDFEVERAWAVAVIVTGISGCAFLAASWIERWGQARLK